ncbi:hypothetical protein LJC10_00690 [Selenomonadales bacterium OttesenSCG-928-I06]|nr:hypothetical protein [Selenomonadales bacterium OttesenSCG-928-I06]
MEYISNFDRPVSYYEKIEMPTISSFRDELRFKDQTTARYDKWWQAATDVIDLIAERVGLNNQDYCLYFLINGSSPIVKKIDEYFDRSGDKVKLKKRIDELENENAVLRSLIGGHK